MIRFALRLTIALLLATFSSLPAWAQFRAGAAITDITPPELPVLVNGSMRSRTVDRINTRIHARSLALEEGQTRVVLVVVDTCMMPRPLLDEVKQLATRQTGVPADHILISATHAHSAPSSMACLGTDADPRYVPFLRDKLVESIGAALSKLRPAEAGFGKANAAKFTALRRWIRRPDRIAKDPFGNPTVRANMHAARNPDDVTGESGPEDPDLSVLAIRGTDHKPIAVLANFSMHYFGDKDISADYYGRFCAELKARVAPGTDFVGIMSHGCSGDIWRRDYANPGNWDPALTIDDYSRQLAELAADAVAAVRYDPSPALAMAESRLPMKYRVPDQQRLQWAQQIVAAMGDRLPETQPEIYAREQLILHQRQSTEVVVQALRIGDVAIATTPTETYAITGLKVKAASPARHTMVIELANGGDGYIPPPEQHLFGGYNTWAARSAGLEVTAEPRIAEAAIELLETVTHQPRRSPTSPPSDLASAVGSSKPVAWWRLDEFSGPRAVDATGQLRDGFYEPHVTYFLEGPDAFSDTDTNRAAMFVGGRLQARLPLVSDRYSISLWCWNGMPADARDVTGWMFSRDQNHGLTADGDHLGVGGASRHSARVIFQHGADPEDVIAGKTAIARWQWHHIALVRDGERVRLYVDGHPDADGTSPAGRAQIPTLFFGGRSDNSNNWEGRLDEIAVYDRALSPAEVAKLAGQD